MQRRLGKRAVSLGSRSTALGLAALLLAYRNQVYNQPESPPHTTGRFEVLSYCITLHINIPEVCT